MLVAWGWILVPQGPLADMPVPRSEAAGMLGLVAVGHHAGLFFSSQILWVRCRNLRMGRYTPGVWF